MNASSLSELRSNDLQRERSLENRDLGDGEMMVPTSDWFKDSKCARACTPRGKKEAIHRIFMMHLFTAKGSFDGVVIAQY